MLMLYLSMLETDEDKQNFERLYIRYAQDMYAVAYNILKNKEDAEDAVHQSFLKIAENFRKISQIPCHEIKPYIVIISRKIYTTKIRNEQNAVQYCRMKQKIMFHHIPKRSITNWSVL